MALQNLRKLRKERHLTQEETARIFNVSATSYINWEKGTFEPDIKTLSKMADFFNTSVDYIIDRKIDGLTPEEKKALEIAAKIIMEKIK